jgi:hypothetical protein
VGGGGGAIVPSCVTSTLDVGGFSPSRSRSFTHEKVDHGSYRVGPRVGPCINHEFVGQTPLNVIPIKGPIKTKHRYFECHLINSWKAKILIMK